MTSGLQTNSYWLTLWNSHILPLQFSSPFILLLPVAGSIFDVWYALKAVCVRIKNWIISLSVLLVLFRDIRLNSFFTTIDPPLTAAHSFSVQLLRFLKQNTDRKEKWTLNKRHILRSSLSTTSVKSRREIKGITLNNRDISPTFSIDIFPIYSDQVEKRNLSKVDAGLDTLGFRDPWRFIFRSMW